MKSALLTAALATLFATTAHAEQSYKVEAHFTFNGKPAGDYVAEIPEDVTGQFSNTQHRLQTAEIITTEGKIPKRVSEPLVTGFQFSVTPKMQTNGKILVTCDLDYRALLSIKHESDAGSGLKLDLPTTHHIEMGNEFVAESGAKTEMSGSGKNGSWELTVAVTKL